MWKMPVLSPMYGKKTLSPEIGIGNFTTGNEQSRVSDILMYTRTSYIYELKNNRAFREIFIIFRIAQAAEQSPIYIMGMSSRNWTISYLHYGYEFKELNNLLSTLWVWVQAAEQSPIYIMGMSSRNWTTSDLYYGYKFFAVTESNTLKHVRWSSLHKMDRWASSMPSMSFVNYKQLV